MWLVALLALLVGVSGTLGAVMAVNGLTGTDEPSAVTRAISQPLADPDPVVIFEHALLYNFEGELTDAWKSADLRSAKILRAGREVSYAEIPSEYGHDAFLMPIPLYHEALHRSLTRVAREVNTHAA